MQTHHGSRRWRDRPGGDRPNDERSLIEIAVVFVLLLVHLLVVFVVFLLFLFSLLFLFASLVVRLLVPSISNNPVLRQAR